MYIVEPLSSEHHEVGPGSLSVIVREVSVIRGSREHVHECTHRAHVVIRYSLYILHKVQHVIPVYELHTIIGWG